MSTDRERADHDAYLARLFALAGDLMCVFDAEGIVRCANAGLTMLGYSQADLLGVSLLEKVHPEDIATTGARLRAAIEGGPPVRFESRLRAKDGAHRWVAWLVSHATDSTYTAVIRDVTERKWVEHELEASLSLVEATLESTGDGLLVADMAGNAVTFNRKFLDMWAISDAVVFSGSREIDTHCESKLTQSDGHLSLVRELHDFTDLERYEVLSLADGRVFERHSRPRRVRGAPDGRVWSFLDVTERVRAERELREHLSMGIEHAVEGIGRLDERGRYTSVNPVLAKMFGVAEGEILGTEWGDRCHPDDRARVVAARSRMPAEGKIEVEARGLRNDGTVVHLRALLVRPEARGGGEGYYAFVRDITEQKEMQERLLLSDRLASMGTLAAGVAHEINNPLSFVIANVTLLSELLPSMAADLGDERLRSLSDLLGDALEGAERVRRIVRDLKVFSRPDDTKSGAVDVHEVLESSLKMACNEIRHRARLVKDYGDAPFVQGNDAQLGQVFLNLLVNAAQAIPEGSVERNEIRVTTRASPDREGWVVVEIHDTGAGIPRDLLARIFDPFFTTKPVGMGTGLGLSVCHGIIAKLGGELTVESEPGVGTTFRVLLRRGEAPPKIARPAPAVVPADEAGVRHRLLVIDDEVMIGKALRRILAKDYEVVACTCGRDALSILEADPPFDLVVCDLMMPEMTGMDLYEELARTRPAVAKRMVFMTGGIFTQRAETFLAEVPNRRLDKPIDANLLRACVRDALRGVPRPT